MQDWQQTPEKIAQQRIGVQDAIKRFCIAVLMLAGMGFVVVLIYALMVIIFRSVFHVELPNPF
jgi:hypothetical protein